MTTYVAVLGLYLVGMFLVGLYGRKYSGTTDSFLTSGKRGTLMLVTASFMASHFGAGFVVGGAEHGAGVGMGGIWYGIACSLSYVVFGAIMSKRLYREGYMTVSDLLSKRYGDNFTANGYAVLNAIASVGIMAGQRLLQALGMDGVTGAVVCTAVVIVYSTTSGLWGVMMTDLIQMVIG
ncbi:MAG: sodium:solute symporter family protein, partial [Synergistaceae bacterium]|nr:sodium:solute symporter family protein [Synergistaceae bacterium]